MKKSAISALVVAMLVTLASPARLPAVAADPITQWSAAASNAATASGMAPLRTPISLAIVHLAMFDAVSAIEGGRRPDALGGRVTSGASSYAAAVEAGYRVLLAEFPAQAASHRATYEELLAAESDSPMRVRGLAVGAEIATALLSLRADDGRNDVVTYEPRSVPGAWLPTPPGFLPVTTAFLGRVRPFTMRSPSQFRPAGPPALDSKKWAREFNEVKALGSKSSSTRTPGQRATALFWEPLAGTVWVPTIRRIAQERSLGLASSARFQAAAFAAFADGLIACWDAKLHFDSWRPVTAIHQGDADSNSATTPDPSWEPLAVTPNFPEYPSGHTCASAAAAQTIEDFFGRGVVIPTRNVLSGEERFYRSATDLVDEVVEARMLLGLHFRSADEDGAEIGWKIARQIRRAWRKTSD
jgi:hypothetical protein